jgi:hypothetical protein
VRIWPFKLSTVIWVDSVRSFKPARDEEQGLVRIEANSAVLRPAFKVRHLIQHSDTEQRRSNPCPFAAACRCAADSEVQALLRIRAFIGRHQREAEIPQQVSNGCRAISVQITFADIGVTIAENTQPVERRLRARRKGKNQNCFDKPHAVMIHFVQIVLAVAMQMKPNILEGESLEDFNALKESLYAQFEPATFTERMQVDMMIQHEWYMRRALRMQQHLSAVGAEDAEPDAKRLNLVARYYKTHERSYAQAKRALESMRKHQRQMESMDEKLAAEKKRRQRQWEQILKKMPTLTDWVN